jgi:hypothetical protein
MTCTDFMVFRPIDKMVQETLDPNNGPPRLGYINSRYGVGEEDAFDEAQVLRTTRPSTYRPDPGRHSSGRDLFGGLMFLQYHGIA